MTSETCGRLRVKEIPWSASKKATGKPRCPLIQFNNSMTTTPAWDGSEVFATTLATGNLSRFTLAEYASKIDTCVSADAGNVKNTSQVPANYPQPAQVKNGVYNNAIVLTPNALVATYTKDSFDRSMSKNPESVDWYLGAFDRAKLATLWETKMPDIPGGFKGEPLYGGLAVARNGGIVVTLRNGNVLFYGKAPNPERPAPMGAATVGVY